MRPPLLRCALRIVIPCVSRPHACHVCGGMIHMPVCPSSRSALIVQCPSGCFLCTWRVYVMHIN
jgi:hypothetical protein